jgi:hypothetical protein
MCCIVPKDAYIFVLSMREVGRARESKTKNKHSLTHSTFGPADFLPFRLCKTQTL